MFFDDLNEVSKIAATVSCAVFVLPNDTEINLKNAQILQPESKASITIEQVQKLIKELITTQKTDRFVAIRPAELLTEPAANAILKTLEEPQEKVHFLLITSEPSRLLPTILSRAETFVWRGGRSGITEIKADFMAKELAKKLLVAKPTELVTVADEITEKKDGVREWALLILATAVEMAYKSYFITGKKAFLLKIPKLIAAHENISLNGHIKLHLVVDLI